MIYFFIIGLLCAWDLQNDHIDRPVPPPPKPAVRAEPQPVDQTNRCAWLMHEAIDNPQAGTVWKTLHRECE